jgi:8-hydroxy-5-deazaflavin:NADPH oxidoreductase
MKKIGILGSGIVGQTLANGFLKYGYEVMIGTGDTTKLSDWKANAGVNASVGSFSEAAAFGDLVVLAVKGTAALEGIKKAGAAYLAGKTVIDTTNPIADAPVVNGVLKFFTGLDDSLMEMLQKAYPEIHFVKAFNSVGNAFMVNPQFPGGKPTMFICGNDDTAKAEVTAVLDLFGWEIEDMGKAEAARAIEPLCMLWCIPGMLRNQWTHAFKLLKL